MWAAAGGDPGAAGRLELGGASPPTYCALRRLTWVVLLTEKGDWPAGAFSDSGIPVLSVRTAVAFSVLVFPRRKFPPFAASAKPAAPMISAIDTATVAGPRDCTPVRRGAATPVNVRHSAPYADTFNGSHGVIYRTPGYR